MGRVRITEEQKVKARKYFIEYGITNISELARMTGITRQTLAGLRDGEGWESQQASLSFTKDDIVQELSSMIADILADIKEKRAAGVAVAPSTKRDLLAFTKSLANIKSDYDHKAAVLKSLQKYIAFVGTLPAKKFR